MESKPVLRLSVQNLVEYVYQSGNIDTRFQSSNRMTEGIKGHQVVQGLRPAEYSAEVPINYHIERPDFSIELNGRIDGLLPTESGVIIEEIKTTTLPLHSLSENLYPAHWAQAMCYGYIYMTQNELEFIRLHITYYQLESKQITSFERRVTYEELETFFHNLVAEYSAWAEVIQNWINERNQSIEELSFPYKTYRKGQREMAIGVYKTVVEGKRLFAQAPTGIGKTLATLFPTFKAMGEGHTSKIFYLTAKTITRTIAEKAVATLYQTGMRCKCVTITAKDKICFKTQTICQPEYCEYAAGYYDRVRDGVKDIFAEDLFTRPVIEKYARKHQICPFEFSLDLALWSDCVICDYNYVFDPKVYLRRFFLEKGRDYVFLIDEAHNLVDRAREMFSAEIAKQPLVELKRVTQLILPDVSRLLDQINDFMVMARRICEDSGTDYYAQQDPPLDLYPLLREFVDTIEGWLAKSYGAPIYDEMLELYFAVLSFLRTSEYYDDHYVSYIENSYQDVKLKLLCLDPSLMLHEALKRGRAAILFSATLTPVEYFMQILGGDKDSYKMRLSSPFPRENLCLMIGDRISTKFRVREQTYDRVTEAISQVILGKQGNYLAFFPSYQYMNEVYTRFLGFHPDIKVIYQESGMSEEAREEFLSEFVADDTQTLVGFAVMGGIFGEGIDLVGERLSGAVIVGVGLPQICAERDIIKEYFTELNGQGFEYAYIYPGMNKVLQAVGRVIRTEKDRGVVLLIDQRFATPGYSNLFPSEWHPIPRVRTPETIASLVKEFWAKAGVEE